VSDVVYFQNQLLDTLSYRQMIGRAGRKGIDTEGKYRRFCWGKKSKNTFSILIFPDIFQRLAFPSCV
jgi:replicative superfamily II helicase